MEVAGISMSANVDIAELFFALLFHDDCGNSPLIEFRVHKAACGAKPPGLIGNDYVEIELKASPPLPSDRS